MYEMKGYYDAELKELPEKELYRLLSHYNSAKRNVDIELHRRKMKQLEKGENNDR